MKNNTYIYIFVMAAVTYLIRALPLTLIRKEIKNNFIKSFLHYVPYVTLSIMIFPAILDSTSSVVSAACGFLVAVILSCRNFNMLLVSVLSCAAVFIVELLGL